MEHSVRVCWEHLQGAGEECVFGASVCVVEIILCNWVLENIPHHLVLQAVFILFYPKLLSLQVHAVT